MKLKLTDSPGIAGGFYWIYQEKGTNPFKVCASFMIYYGITLWREAVISFSFPYVCRRHGLHVLDKPVHTNDSLHIYQESV